MHFQDLSITIELLRTEMISVGIEKGLTAPETVQLSQKLDILLNIQQKTGLPVTGNYTPFLVTDFN